MPALACTFQCECLRCIWREVTPHLSPQDRHWWVNTQSASSPSLNKLGCVRSPQHSWYWFSARWIVMQNWQFYVFSLCPFQSKLWILLSDYNEQYPSNEPCCSLEVHNAAGKICFAKLWPINCVLEQSVMMRTEWRSINCEIKPFLILFKHSRAFDACLFCL